MPIDRDPDEPDRGREAPGAPHARPDPDAQVDLDARPDPDARPVPDAWAGPDGQSSPDARSRADARTGSPAPGGEEARDGAWNPAFRERQLAAHAKYRADVEAADQALEARRSWAEAVPKLRVAWAEHVGRYPERLRASPRTQPDGSWAADGGRRLTPEQNAEATKARADLKDEADQVILPVMRRVETASPYGRLAGLDRMLKGEDRLKEKIADELLAKPGKTVREAISEIADSVRFTLSYPSERYAEGVATDVNRLKAEGFELIKLKNLWTADQYKGINSQWRNPDTGTRFEMQFHTPESREAKELTHTAYERIRGSDASPGERRELIAFQRRVNAQLMTPPGTAEIKDFPEKNSG